MSQKQKLNLTLALTDKLRGDYKNQVGDYIKYFRKSGGSFLGEKRTYTPKEGTMDEPSKRGVKPVATTVAEKIDWFIENSSDFINKLFTQEKTNASGVAKAELMVDGISWGEFTSLELLRLKSLIEGAELGKLYDVIENIPVRSNSEVWDKTSNEEYDGRTIYETERITGIAKTTVKTEYILEDPNLARLKNNSNYTPVKSVRNDVLELGDYTMQRFSGEWSHRERAEALRRRSNLITAVINALKRANDVQVVQSDLTSFKIFDYIFYGSNPESAGIRAVKN